MVKTRKDEFREKIDSFDDPKSLELLRRYLNCEYATQESGYLHFKGQVIGYMHFRDEARLKKKKERLLVLLDNGEVLNISRYKFFSTL